MVDVPGAKPEVGEHVKTLLTTPGRLEFRAIPKRYAFGPEHPPVHDEKDGYMFTAIDAPQKPPVSAAEVLAVSSVLATSADLEPDSRVLDQPGQPTAVTFGFKKAAAAKLEQFERAAPQLLPGDRIGREDADVPDHQ